MRMMLKEQLATPNEKKVTFEHMENWAAEIKDDSDAYVIHDVAKNLWMDDSGNLSFCHSLSGDPEVENMPASSWALSQLSVKLGMPSGYAEKCIERGHADLAANNVNTWLMEQNGSKRKKTTDYLIRTYKDHINAVLSSNYTAFDAPQILDVVKKTINVDDYHIVGSYISDERLHLRMIRDEMLNVDGEDLYPGIFIDSSDVGRTAFHISFGIWKKVCTNGLCISKIGGVLYHQRHVGITPIEVETEMVSRIKKIPELIVRSENVIKSARNDKIDLKDEKVFEKILNDIRRVSKVSDEEARRVIELSQEKYSATRWGIVNAMTEIAQNYELDERIRIENAAGHLM